jgi:tetratricopeptide (TPR) repeat protein
MKTLSSIIRIVVIAITACSSLNVYSQNEQAVKLFNEGIALSNKNENDQAIASFSEAIKLHANYTAAYDWRGYVFYKKKEYDIAVADFNEALRIDPGYASSHFNLGRVSYAKQNYDEAIKEFKEAVRLGSKDKNTYWWIGDAYHFKKDYDAAISNYNEIIRLDPKDVDGYRLRGNAYSAKKDYDKAINDYNNIIRIDSTKHIAYNLRASAYIAQQLYDKAVKDYTEAIRISPKDIWYYQSRANAYKLKGDTALAIADYAQAVQVSGKPATHVSRGWFFIGLKQYDLAIKDFDAATALDSKYISSYFGRAGVYRRTGQLDLALNELSKVLQDNPRNSSVFFNKSLIYKEKGLYEMAVKEFETYLSISPKGSPLYIISPLARIGLFDKAKEYAEKFNALNNTYLDDDKWKFYKYYVTVIGTDLPNQQFDQALENLNRAISDYTTNSSAEEDSKSEYIDILALKGYVLEKLGRFKEAKDVYEQSLVINSMQPDVKNAIVAIEKRSSAIAVNDKTPPEIQLISPQALRGLQVVAANKTEIIGKAKDASGIASITLNGKLITKIEEDGLFTSVVSLKGGANNLIISAVDKKGNTTSKTFTINASVANSVAVKKQEEEIIMPVTSENKPPVYHAILIAEKDYEDPSIPDLQNPMKDAEELKSILEKSYTFNSGNIQTLYNKSREEIMQALVSKSNSLTENDNLLIFYAGHGIAEKISLEI